VAAAKYQRALISYSGMNADVDIHQSERVMSKSRTDQSQADWQIDITPATSGDDRLAIFLTLGLVAFATGLIFAWRFLCFG
jgi:hypothetical protein